MEREKVAPKKRDDNTVSTDHDRIIYLEADYENLESNMAAFMAEARDTLSSLNKKVGDLPSDKSIELLIENRVNKAIKTTGKITPIAYGGGGGALALIAQQIIEKILGG